jgi:hypothetical protein
MPVERSNPAVVESRGKKGGGDGLRKPSICPQDLRREIYVKGKAESAGTGGVGVGEFQRLKALLV